MSKLRYISVQPRIKYYAWQVEVMINNFIKHGIDPAQIDILVAWNPIDGTSTPEAKEAWNKLVAHYTSVNFYFYKDTRQAPIHYIPSIRPNVLKQHFTAFPRLKEQAFFYTDCDIVFTQAPDFSELLGDNEWYVSNTSSYLNASYILSKGQDVYDKMCEIVGIHPSIPQKYDNEAGGAQYVLKNVDAHFWAKVERDCENLYYQITQLNAEKKQQNPEYHELQIWCADMWAVLWNAWMRGFTVKTPPSLDFVWATDPIEKWNTTTIYHNAGVTCACGRQFYKGIYQNDYPYSISQDSFNSGVASYNYVREIIETAQNSCLVTR